ncbi:MAG: hypothetical protein H5T69_19105 [Chloroflexi bacterium]|nr:hypothetical protein [Chloroflexota bacterium]
MDEAIESLIAALHYWNAHRHPYSWKKQVASLGGFGISRPKFIISI